MALIGSCVEPEALQEKVSFTTPVACTFLLDTFFSFFLFLSSMAWQDNVRWYFTRQEGTSQLAAGEN